jgi:transposase-like protein
MYLLCDATFLNRPTSIIALMDANDSAIIAGEYGVKENSTAQLITFFEPLKEKGLHPQSCTIDGNPQMMKALRAVWPDIIIQRCVVHVQRQGLSWLRRNPKRADARALRLLFRMVASINTREEKEQFVSSVEVWEKRYGQYIAQSAETGWVFSDIRRARSMLLHALPFLFHYLDDPGIPRTTNAIEGYFSRLKSFYRGHRGLSVKHRLNYFAWFFTLKRR